MTVNEVADAVIAAERSAGELILHAHHIMAEEKTDPRNVVTAYDRKVQQSMIEALSALIPEAHFFCEEMSHPDSLNVEHVFIIDPIDGTMNFVHGFGHSCISCAYVRSGVPSAGVIYNPYRKELFSAVKGEGAFLNGRPISAPDLPLSQCVTCFGSSPYNDALMDRTFALLRKAHECSLDVRREGAAALDLCSVAAGRAGLFYELELSLWDYAAGAVIAQEAGARCCTATGEPLPYDGRKSSVLAGTPQSVNTFLEWKIV